MLTFLEKKSTMKLLGCLFLRIREKKTSSEISFSLPFSSSNLKVSRKRVQKVKMVLNSSVTRNVSRKNSEEVGIERGGRGG